MGEVLRTYRENHRPKLTQRQLADLLNVDQSHVSRIESGQQKIRSIDFLWRIVRRLGIEPQRLGISPELQSVIEPAHQEEAYQAAVSASQEQWLSARKYLNEHRSVLARAATSLYSSAIPLGGTLITKPGWLPQTPVDLDAIQLEWVGDRVPCSVRGIEPEALQTCPLRAPGRQYERYTLAVKALAPPTLFENRASYRLLGIDWPVRTLTFGLATYFDKLDVAEAVGHEMAVVAMRKEGATESRWADLPFRSLIGDPFELRRRAILPAITTLTLRRDRHGQTATFLLHWREPDKVATAGGLFDAIPAGEFQPSSLSPWDQRNDFDLWRNIVRELSEEFLGNPEHDGTSSEPIDYEGWPLFRNLAGARADRRLKVACLGVGLDALTLAPTIMTALVVDSDVFDELFGNIVRRNAEGWLAVPESVDDRGVTGFPFTAESVRDFITAQPMASPGAACLELAWRHRDLLLAGDG
ncbi:MAG: helix-turn-helix transcriptional regulator [Acidimicrobiaceae bacterium]|nr:helix-turn-helix transcriptional regulator [Acidimicrobiaceae bacterium]